MDNQDENVTITLLGLNAPEENDLMEPPEDEDIDWKHIEQQRRERVCVEMTDAEINHHGDGTTVKDPETGDRYFVCDSCGDIVDLEDFHSGGECNYCHAYNKDD